jgi:hypothetical protein
MRLGYGLCYRTLSCLVVLNLSGINIEVKSQTNRPLPVWESLRPSDLNRERSKILHVE